ncbi:MAG TPA: sugar ABC transporter permease [Herpetosiphon sp.]|uniref:Binding-protein-dependent transport systems inner membrane component n=1 Tax=Herpetosiphon aurantiacus (strain ATCC 23779 / DSM 785 / 114-95) TaxID=316274 RepID=A9AVR6_HERA2|nr:sugar ABC transporter permease [Herpetosiphon sp.]ABX06666.1 binding-protein-dependent transport systems inner membrane component [Herpetosiphon aurantiacus DSM 785]MCA0354025.1 sugar ABC transporter permease [Chloroflexota bacterium]HBW49333.1 sugar ABC transporter permease [Herpetosiphon sp.]
MLRPNKSRPRWHIAVFLAPALLLYSIVMVFPLLDTLRLSLFSSNGESFVGLSNYQRLFTDSQWWPYFWRALKNTVLFFILHMVLQNPLGLLLAALLDSKNLRGRSIYRTLLFSPTMLSFVIVGFVWQLILSPTWGIAPAISEFLGVRYRPWLGLESTSLPTIALISIWQFVGIPMLFFMTALLAVPQDILEAARVDGASAWQLFWRVKFPLILPTVGIVSILTFIGNFNAFDLVYTAKGALAGPNFSTDLLGTFFYRTFYGFQLQLGDYAMGTTIAVIIFLIILFGSLLYLLGWQRKVVTYEL